MSGKGSLPAVVRVGGMDIEIEDWNPKVANAENKWGSFNTVELRFRIDTSGSPFRVIQTFLHEMLHMVWWNMGLRDKDKEERIISALANGLLQVLRDNPDAIAFVAAKLAEGSKPTSPEDCP